MAHAGDELLDPTSRRLVFRRTAEDTNGELVGVDAYYEPGGNPPPVHCHPHQEERLEVVSGELFTHVDGALKGFDDPVRLYEVRWREYNPALSLKCPKEALIRLVPAWSLASPQTPGDIPPSRSSRSALRVSESALAPARWPSRS